jgi:GntR family transcriptional regulator
VSPRSRADLAREVPERRDVYERLADELRASILSGRYKPGDRLPSTLEIMASTGVANLTVRGAYRVLVEEGLVEPVAKRGYYVRRPNTMTWHMAMAKRDRRAGTDLLDRWASDAEAADLTHREEVSVGIEASSAVVLGRPVGERLGLTDDSQVLVRRAVRYTGPVGSPEAVQAESLADEYYPYDLVRESALASPGPVSAMEVLSGLGYRLAGHVDELRPRLATIDERRVLSLPQVSVTLELARTAHTLDRRPVMVMHQVRRGDGAIFSYEVAYSGR